MTRDEEDILRVAKQKGLARTDDIAREHAARSGLDEESLRSYLTESIRYDLGDEELRGLERFWLEASRAGLLPTTAAHFQEPRASGPTLDGLLARAADWLKPGGVLLYATCSVFPEENRAQVAGFTAARPDAVLLGVDRHGGGADGWLFWRC